MFFKSRGETRDKVEVDSDTLQVLLSEAYGNNVSWSGIGALKNSDIFTAVQTIAGDFASSPVEVRVSGEASEDSEIQYLLNKSPNDYIDAWHFKFIITANMLINNCAFVQIIRNSKGKPLALYFLRNSTVNIEQIQGEVCYSVTSDAWGKAKILEARDVLHFRMFTMDGFKAYSPLYALSKEISIQEGSKSFLDSFFRKGASFGGILTFEGAKLSPEDRRKHREEFNEGYAGARNAGGVVVLDSTMTLKQLEIPTEILRFLNSYTFSGAQIAKVFGLPLGKMGIETVNTSAEQANLEYLQTTLYPLFSSIGSEMEFKLIPHPERKYTDIGFNVDRLLEFDPQTKLKIITGLKKDGIITPNEARKKYGYKPVEDGDKLLVSLNNTTLTNLEDYQNEKARYLPVKGGENKDE
ncbi:phage portal protein [Listeria booriae]|uniref:phage portal protein n=1 Tax=Listeria booriae TaxID=1552123 RepID=UPI0016264DE9|nr:phage portal protein [Listeria booriae]MBC2067019.1 phage portal protein [Listeria booriae]